MKRRFRTRIEANESNNTSKSEDSVRAVVWSLIKKYKEISIPLIIAIFTTYAHFWGYSYLKGKLRVVGLADLQLDISYLESIYQAALSFQGIIQGVLKLSNWIELWPLTTLLIIPFFMGIFKKSHSVSKKNFSLETKAKPPKSPGIAERIKIGTALTIVSAFGTSLVIYLIFAVVFVLWAFLSIPRMAGLEDGRGLVSKAICTSIVRDTVSYDRVVGCTRLVTESGKKLVGISIFRNEDYTVFVSNRASYLLNGKNKVLECAPVHIVESDSISPSDC